MKIIHVISSLERRGAQMFAVSLVRELKLAGIEQQLAVISLAERQLSVDSPVNYLAHTKRAGFISKVVELRKLLRSQNPDIILAHGGESLKIAIIARGQKSWPKVVYRKIGMVEAWLGKYKVIKLPFQRWLVKKTDYISAVSAAAKDEAVGLLRCDPEKIDVVYQGVDYQSPIDETESRRKLRDSLKINANDIVLMFIGRLDWEKNLFGMLRAFSWINCKLANVWLAIVGAGPLESNLKRYAKDQGVVDRTIFLGERSDIWELLVMADCVLLTSITEGLPGVLIEAGLAGKPSVSFDLEGVREVILDRETGIISDHGNEEEFARSVVNLFEEPRLAVTLGLSAREFCKRRFSMRECADKHIRIFRQLV